MGDVARPMLAEVLATLTGTEADTWSFDRRSVVRVGADGAQWTPVGVGWASDTAPWITTDPAEAQELLSERGLLPDGWCGDVRRGWYCEACDSYGTQRIMPFSVYGVDDREVPCERCGGGPRTIPDLVAVASLGWTAIDCAEELLREACRALREYGCPQPERVVWRVGERRTESRCWIERTRRVSIGGDGRRWLTTPDQRYCENDDGDEIKPIAALWLSGFALDVIDRDAVRVVVPPVGGVR